MEQIILTGNCFWCLEALYKKLKGVHLVESGSYYIDDYVFAFGKKDKLEAVRITYDPSVLSLEVLFDVFYIAHNPTLIKWDKDDCFYPYCRSAVFYTTDSQKNAAEDKILKLKASNAYPDTDVPVQTKVVKVIPDCFFLTEEKNKDYFEKNPNDAYCRSIVVPKLDKLKDLYKEHLIK